MEHIQSRSPIRPALNWSDWQPLTQSTSSTSVPRDAGVYRVTHTQRSGIDYVGLSQTNLRRRIHRLRSELDSETMPYRDPHTAAPCLWAIRNELGTGFHVSWITVDPLPQDASIEGIKAAYLATYRATVGQSPTANFGRIIPGYEQSTHSNAGERGGPIDLSPRNQIVGLDPPTWEQWDNVTTDQWMGFSWSDPVSSNAFRDFFPPEAGVFRVWKAETNSLAQIGATSNLRSRLHGLMADLHEEMSISYFTAEFADQAAKQEMETDLLGAHYMAEAAIPQSDLDENRLPKEELRALIDSGESESVEFKSALPGHKENVAKKCVGLANLDGGYLFFGVTDNREIVGVDDIDDLEEDVLQIISGNVVPNLRVETSKAELDGEDILVVNVPEATEVLYSVDGTFYLRMGTVSEKVDGWDLKRFYEEGEVKSE